jgi:hypothetical protein
MKQNVLRLLVVGLLLGLSAGAGFAQKKKTTKNLPAPTLSDRQFWLTELDKMVRPVLSSLAHDSLRIVMPKVVSKRVDNKEH